MGCAASQTETIVSPVAERESHEEESQKMPLASGPVRLPTYWKTSEGVSITPAPEQISIMQQLVSETWRVKYTRDRKLADSDGQVPTGARVCNVLRVENHDIFSRYFHYKASVRSRRKGKCTPFHVETSKFGKDLDADVNEMYLFHGTDASAAEAIARSDFDMDRVGSAVGTMFGPGIYLAEHASKSDEYAKEGGGIFTGQCALLLCRAVAGRVNTVEDTGDTSQLVESGFYDSVCGDRMAAVGTFREMVFFNSDAICCEYIILYSRIFGDVSAGPTPTPAPSAPKPTPAEGNDVGQTNAPFANENPRIPPCDHFWDFRGASGQSIKDQNSSLLAHVMDAKWTSEGLYFNGQDAFVNLEPWTWGGPISVEVYCAYSPDAEWNKTQGVFDFGQPGVIHLRRNVQGDLGIFQARTSAPGYIQVSGNFWKKDQWTHCVGTVDDTQIKLFVDGRLIQASTEGYELETAQRTLNWIGRTRDGYFHGTIAFLRIWHGVALGHDAVSALYADKGR